MVSDRLRSWPIFACVAAGFVPTPAKAQESPLPAPSPILIDQFERSEDSVIERYRPEYDSGGIRLGALVLRPSLSTSANYLSNVFGAPVNSRDDAFFATDLTADVALETGDPDRYLRSSAGTSLRRFVAETKANETALFGTMVASTRLTNSVVLAGGGAARRRYERQDSGSFPAASAAPIRYDQHSGFLRLRRDASRVRLLAAADITRFNFADARFRDGNVTINQDFRDRTVYRAIGRAETSVTGSANVFVEASYAAIEYRQRDVPAGFPDLTGATQQVMAGMIIEAGKLRGTAGIGYVRRIFDDGLIQDFGGFAARGAISYFASGLTTFTLNLSRDIAETGQQDTTAFLRTVGEVRIDHELRRNLILSARISHEGNGYRDIGRNDRITLASAGGRYLANRNLSLNAEFAYLKRSSNSEVGARFSQAHATVGGVVRF